MSRNPGAFISDYFGLSQKFSQSRRKEFARIVIHGTSLHKASNARIFTSAVPLTELSRAYALAFF